MSSMYCKLVRRKTNMRMQVVESSEYYDQVRKFMETHEDATDEEIYTYLVCLFPQQGDEYGVPEFPTYELDHLKVHEDKLVFHHRGVTGAYNYDKSFVLKGGNKKEYGWD